MELQNQVEGFQLFFEKNYHTQILETIRKGIGFFIVDFSNLSKFDPELADSVLDNPEESIRAAEVAIEGFDFIEGDIERVRIRFSNLPETQKTKVRNLRSSHIGKFICVEGVVRQKSDVRPQVKTARFECPACGNIISVIQLDSKFKEPMRCGCGRKGKFRLVSKELVDAQGIVLEEAPENLEGGEQPKRMNIFLKDDLVSPMTEKRTNPGSNVIINGYLKEVPIILRSGGQSTRFELIIEANLVESVHEEFGDIDISKDEEAEIKELATDPKIYARLIKSVAPSIYGHDRVKEALLYQLMGGVKKAREDGVVTRGDIHVLLIGDPGSGKCLSGDSKLFLENGEITTIKLFYEDNVGPNTSSKKTGIFSINGNGLNFRSEPVRFWRRKAPKKMLKIVTNTGNEVVVTKEHPLFTTNNGLIFAKRAEDYEVGDFIALPSRIDVTGEIQKVYKKVKPSRSNNRVRYKVKDLFDSDFARLLGYLVGDGYVRFRKTTGIISFTNKNRELLVDFENLVKRVFRLGVTKRKIRNSNCYEYYVSSIELVRLLEKIDPNIIKGSGNMGISKTVFKSPNYIVREFLGSFFDCEGHVNRGKREVEVSSKSRDLIFDLKYLLLRFGIISQVSSGLKCATNTKNKTKREYYRLRISGEDLIKFHTHIGFCSQEKQKQLEVYMKKRPGFNTNLNVVPHLKRLLRTLRKKYGLSQFDFPVTRTTYQHYERGDRFPSYHKLRQICGRYKEFKANDPLIEVLNQISNADVFWDRIKEIKTVESKGDFVYDLEIERVHNFVANGVMVHNSQLLKRISRVAPKSRFVSGKGASGAGLTAAVVRDEFLKGWSLEAGALVLAHKGLCCIDELDKMSTEDRDAMHEALEGQTITISKANIQATLRAETTVLAAANPKFGRFDLVDTVARQIDLPPTLINRFDLIFPIKDLPDKDRDEEMAKFILNLHQNPKGGVPEIKSGLLRKYLAYAKQNITPKLSDSAIAEIKEYYIKMRSTSSREGDVRRVPISPRQLEALVRLTEASAKVRLADKATKKDARRAVSILHYCLAQIGVDPETGEIDIDRISTGITATERSKIVNIREIIAELESSIGKNIPINDIVRAAADMGMEEDKVEEAIEKLKRSGDIFEPKRGFISRL